MRLSFQLALTGIVSLLGSRIAFAQPGEAPAPLFPGEPEAPKVKTVSNPVLLPPVGEEPEPPITPPAKTIYRTAQPDDSKSEPTELPPRYRSAEIRRASTQSRIIAREINRANQRRLRIQLQAWSGIDVARPIHDWGWHPNSHWIGWHYYSPIWANYGTRTWFPVR